jgi:hypothetical protein
MTTMVLVIWHTSQTNQTKPTTMTNVTFSGIHLVKGFSLRDLPSFSFAPSSSPCSPSIPLVQNLLFIIYFFDKSLLCRK